MPKFQKLQTTSKNCKQLQKKTANNFKKLQTTSKNCKQTQDFDEPRKSPEA